MRFTPSKANDGKILASVDLSEINYKPLPTRFRVILRMWKLFGEVPRLLQPARLRSGKLF
jgi:hypothetical protein